MSSYITFRKNGVRVGSYSRSSKIYQAIGDKAPYGKWGELKPEIFGQGISELRACINVYEKRIKSYQNMLPYAKTMEDVRELQAGIDDFLEDIEEYRQAISTLEVYQIIFDPYDYEEDEEGKIKDTYEWMLD